MRVLRYEPAARFEAGADLFVRMHVLRRLRKYKAWQCLPELWRRTRRTSNAIDGRTRKASCVNKKGIQAAELWTTKSTRVNDLKRCERVEQRA